ncbi:MAG: Flp pilus assembly complex ATPase component TadA, partial [Candidatus Omnitrophica bacterium]|nr:Flp pilus assembly complex ATPase component TadA [Candidatus Omnitrophota bacterium]
LLLGQMLVDKGLITALDLERALKEQKRAGEFLGVSLVKLNIIDEDTLMPVLAEQLGIQYVKIRDLKIDPAVVEKVPAKFASHYRMIPVAFDSNTLTLCVLDPLDIHTLDDIRLLLGYQIRPALCGEKDILEAIRKYYGIGAETLENITTEVSSDEEGISLKGPEVENIEDLAQDASIIKFVNQILLGAYQDRATEIHIEPYADDLNVRYRVDGVLHDAAIPPAIKQFQAAIISRIKIMANLNIAERRLPQDGRIKVKVGDEEVDLRVSVLPTAFGEGIDIRILSTKMLFSLANLGLLEDHLVFLEELIKKPHGIIFVTGPTGSGKTTTLYACLNKLNKKELKVITIEDPIEYQIPGITQIHVLPKIGLTFAVGLRSILRHDPDIMMVGEVRDYETAEITIRSALTGHLVFSTLHTNDAAGGITRLLDMKIEPYLVASSVECFIAQRLVRLICPSCRAEVPLTREVMRELGVQPEDAKGVKIFEGGGCENCKFTGYKGRTAIYEFLMVTPPIKELILQRVSSDKIKKRAVAEGMRTLAQDGWLKIKKGITTPSEVLRVAKEVS